MNHPPLRTLITASRIEARVAEIGRQITKDYTDPLPLRLVGLLKGGCFLLADLARAIERETSLDFMAVRSYGQGTRSSGQLRVTKDLDDPIAGLDVLVIEDIVDTGQTLGRVLDMLRGREPRSLRVATLLDKPSRRVRDVELAYVGFEIPDEFVVGYGLDYAERYRNLRDICVLEAASGAP